MAANHTEVNVFNTDINSIMEFIKSGKFAGHLNLEMKSENPAPGGVWYRFHHGMTAASWGEKITITLTSISALETKVEVRSECGMPTQVIDWGKNRQNACNIIEHIEANVKSGAIAASASIGGEYGAPELEYTKNDSSTPLMGRTHKYCHNCGTKLEADDRYCYSCGTKQVV